MAKARIKVKSGKGGTKLASSKLVVTRTDSKPKGKPVWQTRAQMNVHVLNKYGNKRS